MTTIAERISQIEQNAKARGFTAERPNRASFSEAASTTLEPADSRLSRPLPCAWLGSCNGNAANALKRLETRLAANLICQALGTDWHREIDDEYRWSAAVKLVHSSGLELGFGGPPSRYAITPRYVSRKVSTITVSAKRSPLSIARDIQRRILDAGALEAFKALQANRKEDRAEAVAKRLVVLRLARAAGERCLKTHYSCYPETNWIELPNASIHATSGYMDRCELNMERLLEDDRQF